MKYMVVFWDSERREYVILHYSHHYGECEKRFLELKKQYPTCQLMFDYNDLSMSEAREKFKAMQKEINDKIAAMKCPQLNLGVLTEEYEDAED